MKQKGNLFTLSMVNSVKLFLEINNERIKTGDVGFISKWTR